jgi:septum site-determining protein MinC
MTANAMELALLTSVGMSAKSQQTATEKDPGKEPTQTAHKTDESEKDNQAAPQQEQSAGESDSRKKAAPTLLISSPVRSGQRIIAPHGDMIVTTTVNSGAEILAAGNIHVYGTLRGRALAGIEGDENAKIFCQHLEADLVSIAGIYRINDDFPEELRDKPVQIQIRGSDLLITSL